MNVAFQQLLSEYPLDKLLQTIPTGLFLVDTEKHIVYWNAEAERITGYTAQEVIGQHCSLLQGDPCHAGCRLFSDSDAFPVINQTCSFHHKNGAVITLSKNIDLIRDIDGTVIGGIESFVEITQLKREEDLLREAVAQRTAELEREKAALRSVLDGMTDPVYICSDQYQLVFVNQAMVEILGDVAGTNCHETIYNEPGVCSDCPMAEVFTGKVVRQEKMLVGSDKIFEVIHSPYPDKSSITQKLAVCRDITERIQTEERLQQANNELDAFVSTVSHDLRSPLTPLIGFADLLIDRYGNDLDEIGQISVKEIKKTAEKMRNLLEDLLTLSRVEQLKQPQRPVDVTLVANEMLFELADKVIESSAQVTVAELPALRIPEELVANMFRNLLTNAIKYAVKTHPLVEVDGEEINGHVRYRVRDHGPGVGSEEINTIFEPFFRGKDSRHIAGTGIGLATVAKIARVYGGRAWVEPTPGGGATFMVEFPTREN